jgi:uncharacterized protein with beta-barrel porin domain
MRGVISCLIFLCCNLAAAPILIEVDTGATSRFSGTSSALNTSITITNASSVNFADQSDPANASISLDSGSSLIFSQTSPTVYTGQLLGNGDVFKSGAGNLTMQGDNSLFSGLLSVQIGKLFLEGNYGGTVSMLPGTFVSYGGSIAGDLNVTEGTISTSGTGVFTVFGTYSQSADATYIAQFSSSGQASLISTPQTASIAGFVSLDVSQGVLTHHLYPILQASGGVSGTYALDNPYPSLLPLLSYDSDHVYVSFGTNFESIAATSNEKKVAQQIDLLSPTTPEENSLVNSLIFLSPGQAQDMLNQLTGEQYSSLILTTLFDDAGFRKNIYDAFRDLLSPCASSCPGGNVWITGGGGRGFQEGNSSHPGFHTSNQSVTTGVHSCLEGEWLLGGALGYDFDSVHSDLQGNGKLRTGQLGLYSSFKKKRVYIAADIIGARTWARFIRPVQHAKSNPRLTHGRFDLQVGTNWGSCKWRWQPYVAGSLEAYHQARINEKGGGATDLVISPLTKRLASSQLGLHFSMNFIKELFIDVDLGWQHYYGNLQVNQRVAFKGFGTSFEIEGPQRGHDGGNGAVYLSTAFRKGWMLYFETQGELWKNWHAYTFNGGVNYKW